MTVRIGQKWHKLGDDETCEVVAIKDGRVAISYNWLDAAEWWPIERFDKEQWENDHGLFRENLSGHRVCQTVFVPAYVKAD
jgi:hypothetical protein